VLRHKDNRHKDQRYEIAEKERTPEVQHARAQLRASAPKDQDHSAKKYLPMPPVDFYDLEEIREKVEQDMKHLKKKK